MNSSSSSSSRRDNAGMNAPTILPRKRKQKTILQENDYITMLSNIIGRNYFPETEYLKSQLEILNILESNIPDSIKEKLLRSHEFKEPTTKVQISLPEYKSETQNKNQKITNDIDKSVIMAPTNLDLKDMTIQQFFNEYTSEDNQSFDELHELDRIAHRRQYHWAYDGDASDGKQAGMLMLYYLRGKVLTAEERKEMDRILYGESKVGDSRQNAPITWPFRTRNQLMFPPTLEDSEKICRIPEQSSSHCNNINISSSSNKHVSDPLLLSSTDTKETNPLPSRNESSNLIKQLQNGHNTDISNNHRVSSQPIRAAKSILAHNTSLRSENDSSVLFPSHQYSATPLEAPHTPSILSDTGTDFSEMAFHGESSLQHTTHTSGEYNLVNMTPMISPGLGKDQVAPLMTYGEICATPMILDPIPAVTVATSSSSSSSSSSSVQARVMASIRSSMNHSSEGYEMAPPSHRDQLARELETRVNSSTPRYRSHLGRGSNSSYYNPSVVSKPSRHHNSHSSHRGSTDDKSYVSGAATLRSSSRLASMSPAAVSLATRLAQRRGGTLEGLFTQPFGGSLR